MAYWMSVTPPVFLPSPNAVHPGTLPLASVGIPNQFFKVGTYYYNWSTIGPINQTLTGLRQRLPDPLPELPRFVLSCFSEQ